jgi:hypothetical protein
MVITQSRPDFNMRAIDMERFVSAFNRKSNLRLVSPATTEAERKLLLDLSTEEYHKYPASRQAGAQLRRAINTSI